MTGPHVLAAHPDETEMLRLQLLQAQRLSSVGTLASSVAHEFNNILTTIINYAKLGLRGAADPNQKQAFEKILKGGQRAALIVSGMLGFARNQSHRRESVDLVQLVEEVLLLTEKDLSKHRIQVDKRYHARPVVPVVAGQIEQILINLVIQRPAGDADRRPAPRGHPRERRGRDGGGPVGRHRVRIPADQLRLSSSPSTTKDLTTAGTAGPAWA